MNNLYKEQQNKSRNIAERMNKSFNLKQVKGFIKAIKNNQYECYLKLVMAYQLSRFELLNLEWRDIDFENNTITIHLAKYTGHTKNLSLNEIIKNEKFKRTFPLLPNIKKLLISEQQKQATDLLNTENFTNQNYVCIKRDGTRLNINTLSRNLRDIARSVSLPDILLSGLKLSLDDFMSKNSRSTDYYMAWSRFDHKANPSREVYGDYNLTKNSKFINSLNDILEGNQSEKSGCEM